MQILMQKADLLTEEALPYIQKFKGKTFVIKYGGNAMKSLELQKSVMKDIAFLNTLGINVVVVHGGGPNISDEMKKAGVEPQFVNGLRVTDLATIKIVEKVSLQINSEICELLSNFGASAVGVFNSITCEQKDKSLGFVGEVKEVDLAKINEVISSGKIPVISPLGISKDGFLYNINADTAAVKVAVSLKAEKLTILTDVNGVLENGELISHLSIDAALKKIQKGVITKGMIPKVEACIEAVDDGCPKAHLINGTVNHSLLFEIFTKTGIGTEIVKNSGNEIKEKESQHIMQNYGRFDIALDHGHGAYVFDTEGKKYLDFIGGIACVPLGHANEKIAEAVYLQMKKLTHVSNLYYTEPQVKLAEKLSNLSGLKKCFFCNSGAEANEAAIKLAKKVTGKGHFIAFENGFHGRTHGSLSATWKEKYKQPFKPLVEGFSFVPYNNLLALEKEMNFQKEKLAGIIIEPIQGEGGIIVPDLNYLKGVESLCRKNGILLIVDEVQSGNGRCGKYFAYQNFGITPDIVTTAKGLANGLPIGVCISNLEFGKGDHGSTFGGNNVTCEAANETIDYILENKLMENAVLTGDYLMKKLLTLSHIKEVKGMGLMIGARFEKKDGTKIDAKKLCQICADKGLLVNNVTEDTLRFLPPLIITQQEVDEAIVILQNALKEMQV